MKSRKLGYLVRKRRVLQKQKTEWRGVCRTERETTRRKSGRWVGGGLGWARVSEITFLADTCSAAGGSSSRAANPCTFVPIFQPRVSGSARAVGLMGWTCLWPHTRRAAVAVVARLSTRCPPGSGAPGKAQGSGLDGNHVTEAWPSLHLPWALVRP